MYNYNYINDKLSTRYLTDKNKLNANSLYPSIRICNNTKSILLETDSSINSLKYIEYTPRITRCIINKNKSIYLPYTNECCNLRLNTQTKRKNIVNNCYC